jgi:hypothetical protein
MAQCRGCGKEIDWQFTAAGKRMPVDHRPFFLMLRGRGADRLITVHGDVVAGRIMGEIQLGRAYDPQREAVGRKPHFATCSHASDFRIQPLSATARSTHGA